jgi:chromosome segregation ATPase
MNDISHQLCTEEEIIYEIVDDIINTENKITEMTNSLIINNDSNLNQPQFNLKHKISKNISEINSLNSDLKNKKNDLKLLQKTNQKEINDIEMHIQEIEMKIKNISNINNIREDIYKISYEKIEEIIHKKKNEDDLKQTFYEYSNYNSQLQNLKINLTSLQMQYNQIQERLQLLNEEINSTEDNIINLLSQKESIEELCNLLFKINTSHKNNQNILNTNNNVLFSTMSKYNITTTLANQSELRNIELFHYEICQCDIAKISKDISEIILNYINTSLNTTTIQTNTNNILMYEDNNEMMLNHKGTSKVTSTSKNISINHYNGSESESYYSNQHLSGNYSDADEDDEENEGTENNLEDDSRSETSKNSNIIIQSLLET